MAIVNAEFWEKDKARLTILDVKGETHHLIVDLFDYELYCTGHKVQDCFPYLSANDRELIISGIPGEFWDEIFDQQTGNSF